MHKNRKTFLAALKKEKIRKNVIEAFEAWRQEDFFDDYFKPSFYTEQQVPIGFGEKSDPPLALARMISHLAPQRKWRVLEVGTGSGYSTAILSLLVREVVSIDDREELAREAKARLTRLKVRNVRLFSGDGTERDPELGLFDAIILLGACQKRPLALTGGLKREGKMIFPMGPMHQQQIALLIDAAEGRAISEYDEFDALFQMSFHEFCAFTPLRGKYGMA